jgi:mRNA interferase MazF
MVGQIEILTRGGVYLGKLNPAKHAEIGKVRPVIILNSQLILDSAPPVIFTCPLSSQSQKEFRNLHYELSPRDNLRAKSYALIEHCRAISLNRIVYPRIGQLSKSELDNILNRLQRLVGL